MTREQIIELAREAGFVLSDNATDEAVDRFRRFATLIATAEREACARVCEKRAEERFNELGTREHDTGATYYEGMASEEYEARDEEDLDCAAAIRARGQS